MVKPGQLRRWTHQDPYSSGGVFLVLNLIDATQHPDHSEIYVESLLEGGVEWDNLEWVEARSELISEAG